MIEIVQKKFKSTVVVIVNKILRTQLEMFENVNKSLLYWWDYKK